MKLSLFDLLGFSLWFHQTVANTEIVNFRVSRDSTRSIAYYTSPEIAQWSVLNQSHNEVQLHVMPAPLDTPLREVCASSNGVPNCPHEVWVTYAFPESGSQGSSFTSYTLRISWPASYPTDFLVEIYDFDDIPQPYRDAGKSSVIVNGLRKYARIRAVSTGVIAPSFGSEQPNLDSVPFMLIMEPLHFGVLPSSLIPWLKFLSFVLLAAAIVLPKILRLFDGLAADARREIEETSKVD